MTGWERVLERLRDGEWHSSYELTHELQVMAHSRIADLRKRGLLIESRRVAGDGLRAYEYRLLGGVDEQVVTGSAPEVGASTDQRDDDGVEPPPVSTPVRRPRFAQPTLFEAA